MILGFEHRHYVVNENIGSSKVCIKVKNGVPQSVLHLSLTTVDGTATGNHCSHATSSQSNVFQSLSLASEMKF